MAPEPVEPAVDQEKRRKKEKKKGKNKKSNVVQDSVAEDDHDVEGGGKFETVIVNKFSSS